MRAIQKMSEPRSLAKHRDAEYATFDNYQDRAGLQASLVGEQRGLCCYCLSRIPDVRGMKIEHWHPQSKFCKEQLDYSNLLGACMGGEGQPPSKQHCDTRKGNRLLSRSPANPVHAIEDVIRFKLDGRVDSNDPGMDTELNEVLNLNFAFLKNNRKAVLKAFTESLGRRAWTVATLEQQLRKWNGESDAAKLQPYCQVVVYFLRKRLGVQS